MDAALDPLIGRVLQDRYHILERIGKGGMGTVYLAQHVLIQRKVALKTLHAALSASSENVRRFHREAVAAANIGNQHIANVTDMGQLEQGTYFIVLEYLEGADLARHVESEGPFSYERTLRIGLQLCDALCAVHAAGIIHRDLKPDNVFLTTRDGQPDFVKVLDFGICKVRDPGTDPTRLTETGIVLGTPAFMAPEQIEGRVEIDPRADLYAVGALLYYALTGEPPFMARSLPSLFMRVCHDPPPSLRLSRADVPPELEQLITRALSKSPDDRQQSAAELRHDLSAVLTSLKTHAFTTSAHPIEVPSAARRSVPGPITARLWNGLRRRWPQRAALTSLSVLALGASWLLSGRAPEDASPAVASSAGLSVPAYEAAPKSAADGGKQELRAQAERAPNLSGPSPDRTVSLGAVPSPSGDPDAAQVPAVRPPAVRRPHKAQTDVAANAGRQAGAEASSPWSQREDREGSSPQPSAATSVGPTGVATQPLAGGPAAPPPAADQPAPEPNPKDPASKPKLLRRELLHVY